MSETSPNPSAEVSPPPTPTPPTPTPETPTPAPKETSLLNEGAKSEPEPIPDKYSDFATPEGYELDKGVVEEAGTLFKELGLSQSRAQKLVDFYSKHAIASANESVKLWQDTREAWINEVKASPDLGGKLDQVKTTISKAIDGLGDPKLASDFREAMDYTGAGNNPAFIRAFYKLSQKVTEGTAVGGGGPVNVRSDGTTGRPSLAQAIYGPNGPASARVGPNDR
jgi:hypothetical protein